jgi:acyl phosphate:glycerol-3-phosphate acyltransferase
MPFPDPLRLTLWCLGAFLAGSIPFGLVLVKLAGKGDVREKGSGNIGATNVSRVGGKALGVVTLLLDIFKGWLPVWLAGFAFAHSYGAVSLVALAAVLGHAFTPWLKFQGGKGVATTLGALLAAGGWLAVAPCVAVFAVTLVLTRFVSLGSILGALCMPVAAKALFFWFKAPDPLSLWGNAWNWMVWLLLAVLVIAKHHENIRRLLKGTESRLWGGGPKHEEAPHG